MFRPILLLGLACFVVAVEVEEDPNSERFLLLGKTTSTFTSYIISTTSINTISVNYCYSTLNIYATATGAITSLTSSATINLYATTPCRKRRWAVENPINLNLAAAAAQPERVARSAVAELKDPETQKDSEDLVESSKADVVQDNAGGSGRFGLTFVSTVLSTLTTTTYVATATAKSTITVACIPPQASD